MLRTKSLFAGKNHVLCPSTHGLSALFNTPSDPCRRVFDSNNPTVTTQRCLMKDVQPLVFVSHNTGPSKRTKRSIFNKDLHLSHIQREYKSMSIFFPFLWVKTSCVYIITVR